MTVMNKDEAAKLNEIFRRKSSAALNSLVQTPPRSSVGARVNGLSGSSKPPLSPVPTRKSTSVLNRPTWVDSISDEFNVKLSETQNATPKRQIFDVSPAPKKRSLPRVRFSDNDNVRVLPPEPEVASGSPDLDNEEPEDKHEVRKRKQREKRRRRGVLLSEPETET